ncbi:hypothetical protein GCM10010401_16370 [Rarobacter faecitabidus]
MGGTIALTDGATLAGTYWMADEDWLLLAVIDGIGGHAGGVDAAFVAAGEMIRIAAPRTNWAEAIEYASDRVAAAGKAWGTERMGATVAGLVLSRTHATSINLGDCRSYQVAEGRIELLSTDDHEPQGSLTVVTQHLGGVPRVLDPHRFTLEHGETGRARYLVCSDGLHRAVPPGKIRSILQRERTALEAHDALITVAQDYDTDDNYSLIVADVGPA